MHRPWCHSIGLLASAADCCAVGVDTEGLSGLGGGQGAWWCSDIVTHFGCITGQQLHVYKSHDNWVNGVAIAPNLRFFITTPMDKTASCSAPSACTFVPCFGTTHRCRRSHAHVRQDQQFKAVLSVMGDVYASALGTTGCLPQTEALFRLREMLNRFLGSAVSHGTTKL